LDILKLGVACIAGHHASSEELLQLLPLLGQQLQILFHLNQTIIRALIVDHMPGTLNPFISKGARLGCPGCHDGFPPGSPG
jgi:hypothetical protein